MKSILLAILLSISSALGVRLPGVQADQKITPTPLPQISIYPSITLIPTSGSAHYEEDILSIKNAFAAKYGRKVTDVILDTTSYNGTHFIGHVSFKLAMDTGILLAAQDKTNNWVIVMDGKGDIPCEAIKPYNFPVKMVNECYNRFGKLVNLK